jgi:hypothetical protein
MEKYRKKVRFIITRNTGQLGGEIHSKDREEIHVRRGIQIQVESGVNTS